MMSKISLLVMIFASLAPTVSYALASHSNPNLFQEICSANGAKKFVVLQILTTQGNQHSTAFDIKPQANKSPPVSGSMGMHFEHCPLCASHIDVIQAPNLSHVLFVAELNAYQHIPIYHSPLTQHVELRANLPQAPPLASIY